MDTNVAGNNDEDREWMYDLEHQSNINPYFKTNEAYTCLLGGFVADALERWNGAGGLREKLNTNVDDEVSEKEMVGLPRLAEIIAAASESHNGFANFCEELSVAIQC
jgi:hypothetical protein